jgi:hypothetical protein
VGFGLASATKAVQLHTEPVKEEFEIPAGGLRFEGRVGDARILSEPGNLLFGLPRYGSRLGRGLMTAVVRKAHFCDGYHRNAEPNPLGSQIMDCRLYQQEAADHANNTLE